jgi:hypothetical protein
MTMAAAGVGSPSPGPQKVTVVRWPKASAALEGPVTEQVGDTSEGPGWQRKIKALSAGHAESPV